MRATRRHLRKYKESPSAVSKLITPDKVQRLRDIGFIEEPSRGPKWHSRKWTNKNLLAKQQQQQTDGDNDGSGDGRAEAATASSKKSQVGVSPELVIGNWEDMLHQLHEFRKEHGHLNIPLRDDRYRELRVWVARQRKMFTRLKQGLDAPLSGQQIAKLAQVGVKLETDHYYSFDQRAEQWRDYYLKHGKDPIVKRGESLGDWVSKTRKKYLAFQRGEKVKLTQDQIDRLSSKYLPEVSSRTCVNRLPHSLTR